MPTPKCWICLDKVYEKRVKTWRCPECNAISHMKCLVDYLTAYDFNRVFCPTCNRIFSDSDLSTILSKKDFKAYCNKVMNAAFDYFITNNLARVNEVLYYRKLWYDWCTKVSWQKITKITKMIEDIYMHEQRYVKYIDVNDEIVDALTKLHNNGFDIHKLSSHNYEKIRPSTYLKIYQNDPDYQIFKDMKPYIARHLFFKASYIDAIKDADEVIDKPKVLMNCKHCEGVVVTFNNRSYCLDCQRVYCRKCGELKETTTKVNEDGEEEIIEHECISNNVEAFTLIKQVTKPCPKCGVRIQRSEGCSQMFCVNCHTGFDWNTGELITQNFHNPHRIEWLRSLQSQEMPQIDTCNIDTILRYMNRSSYYHIQNWSQMIGAIRSSIHSFVSVDMKTEDKIYHKLVKKASIASILKTAAGAHYIQQQIGDIVTTFIDASISIYQDYMPSSDKFALDLLTNFMKEMANYNEIISKYAVEQYLSTKSWIHYIVQWYKHIPDKTGLELDIVFTKFALMGHNTSLRDDMMK